MVSFNSISGIFANFKGRGGKYLNGLTDRYPVKVLIAGAGSIGSVLGVLLASEHDVTLMRRRDEGIVTLTVTGVVEESASLPIVSRGKGNYDLVIITCQGQQTRSVLENLEVGKSTVLLSLQNGVDNLLIIQESFPENKVCGGLIWWSATLVRSDLVYYHREAPTVVGECSFDLCRILSRFNCEITGDLKTELYRKLVLNVVSPALALRKLPYPQGLGEEVTRRLTRAMFEEACLIVSSRGIDLRVDRLRKFYRLLKEGRVPMGSPTRYVHKVSTQIGLEKHGGRGSNVEVLLGKLIEMDTKGVGKTIRVVRDLVLSLPNNYDPVPTTVLSDLLSTFSTNRDVEYLLDPVQ